MAERTDSYSLYESLLGDDLSDPWAHSAGELPAYEPDYALLGGLLTLPVRSGAMSESGIFPKGIDTWGAGTSARWVQCG